MNAPVPALMYGEPAEREPRSSRRFLGIDLGAETIKVVELSWADGRWRWRQRRRAAHHQQPGPALLALLQELDWPGLDGAVVTGVYSPLVKLPAAPVKQAQARGCRLLLGDRPATVVSIGARGFSVLELHADQRALWRQNNRCSQGTGNFLRQLVERLSLSVEAASVLCAEVEQPATLSARCPVILKTDVTHLANQGEDRARILAGCFDAVGENVLALVKPSSPSPVLLTGGVCQSARVQKTLRAALERLGLAVHEFRGDEGLYLEALGCALLAAEQPAGVPMLEDLLAPHPVPRLKTIPPLADALTRVHRLAEKEPAPVPPAGQPVILGLDIGSTGAKAVALDARARQPVWQAYRRTLGDPVGAAQALVRDFLAGPAGQCAVVAVGVTGSGREIVGGLLTACCGQEPVFVLNEIAAHAEGARFHDPRVDTIFEIGGQDAKYIRLADGKVVDCAMNEACSAGTGSFLEEQGRKLGHLEDVRELGREALAAPHGISLGQHCSVFMAEMIDQAVLAGVSRPAIAAGLYDSIIQNYLHRVKGSRSVGQVVFCQGMPFAADALAAAVARRTGSEVIVPPHPGTIGALGIALLAQREISATAATTALPLERFLAARVVARDCFHCHAIVGCGGVGQRCRIERLRTLVQGRCQTFTWGGGCALHDRATRRKKLPDRAPDPFREREAFVDEIAARLSVSRGCRRVALTDEFMLKGLFPFFARFLYELGLDLAIVRGAGPALLKQGIQRASVPFCAPMQLFHGLAAALADTGADYVFVPRLRSLPRVNGEPCAVTCPIAQASAEILRHDLRRELGDRLLFPLVDVGQGNLQSTEFKESCRRLAEDLEAPDRWEAAWRLAVAEQRGFEARCEALGQDALEFCRHHQIVPVVVLGRNYTIYNQVLNSNVPAILREQGALAIPVDCYPADHDTPGFDGVYWAHSQRILRAAHQLRRAPGVYSVFCSNYSCGPDSFGLQFYTYIMAGKPFAIIETDGHAGDAGTRTRIEAFLHCVNQDRAADSSAPALASDFQRLNSERVTLADICRRGETLLIPWMGRDCEVLAAALRAGGLRAEALPEPDAAALELGRRHTSGKECLPMCLTLGGILQYARQHPQAPFAVLMPRSCGPCRLGMYRLLDRIVLEQLGVPARVYSPADNEYFKDLPPGVAILACAGFVAHGWLYNALLEVRPEEDTHGAANEVFQRRFQELLRILEGQRPGHAPSLAGALAEVASGRLFGLGPLLADAAREFAALRIGREKPTVMLVGEIYVRLDPFANDHVIEQLEQRGLRVRLAPLGEWLDYCEFLKNQRASRPHLGRWLSRRVQRRIQDGLHDQMARALGWPPRLPAVQAVAAAARYLSRELYGEAVLTLGTPLAEWRAGRIDGVVSVGPLECMPNKIAEAQFHHAAEQEGLPSLTLPFNGEPLDPCALDTFAFEVKESHRRRAGGARFTAPEGLTWIPHGPSPASQNSSLL